MSNSTFSQRSVRQLGPQVWRDFVQEMAGEARYAFAGWLWHIVLPLAPLGVYLALAMFRVFATPDGIDSAVYMTVGATVWMLYAGLVTAPLAGLRGKGKLAAQTGYPLIGVIAGKALHVVFDTLVRAALCAAVLAWRQPPMALGSALLALLAGAPLFLGAGIILAVFAAAVRDLERIVPLVLQYTFFLSFAIFPLPLPAEWIAANPFATLIDNVRHLLMFGALATPLAYAVWCLVGALVLLQALGFLARAERMIIGHL
jgi:ABC-type polysaccharide/polyol phosphate export permease